MIYHAEVLENADKLTQDFDFIKFNHDEDYGVPFPADHSYKIHFQAAAPQIMTQCDFHFGETLPQLNEFFEKNEDDDDYEYELHEEYAILSASEQHRVGGYPFFTQSDVREWEDNLNDYVLLFQLVSDFGYDDETRPEILWGDAGVGNFFIRPDDLKNLAFDKAFFTMDCS